jgi:hypothetical protein
MVCADPWEYCAQQVIQMALRIIKQTALGPDDDWRVAVHESGHAIAAVKFGFIFQQVEVGPNEHGEVDVQFSPLDRKHSDASQEELMRWQIFYAAGAAAEHLVFDEIREHGIRKDRADHCRVNEMLVGRESTFEDSVQKAIQLLDSKLLQSVAKELHKSSRLSIEEMHSLVGVPIPWE